MRRTYVIVDWDRTAQVTRDFKTDAEALTLLEAIGKFSRSPVNLYVRETKIIDGWRYMACYCKDDLEEGESPLTTMSKAAFKKGIKTGEDPTLSRI